MLSNKRFLLSQLLNFYPWKQNKGHYRKSKPEICLLCTILVDILTRYTRGIKNLNSYESAVRYYLLCRLVSVNTILLRFSILLPFLNFWPRLTLNFLLRKKSAACSGIQFPKNRFYRIWYSIWNQPPEWELKSSNI